MNEAAKPIPKLINYYSWGEGESRFDGGHPGVVPYRDVVCEVGEVGEGGLVVAGGARVPGAVLEEVGDEHGQIRVAVVAMTPEGGGSGGPQPEVRDRRTPSGGGRDPGGGPPARRGRCGRREGELLGDEHHLRNRIGAGRREEKSRGRTRGGVGWGMEWRRRTEPQASQPTGDQPTKREKSQRNATQRNAEKKKERRERSPSESPWL
jgi:hypothetical protein